MEICVLWNPEEGSCTQCGTLHRSIRRYTCNGAQTVFCLECWNDFIILECNILQAKWEIDIVLNWENDVTLRLEYEDGNSSRAAYWN